MSVEESWLPSRLPVGREARARLAMKDSVGYVRRMGSTDVDRLLLSLSKIPGLSQEEVDVLRQEKVNVPLEYIG